jgi:hypothetical protein
MATLENNCFSKCPASFKKYFPIIPNGYQGKKWKKILPMLYTR